MLILLDKLVESGLEIETGAGTQSGTLTSNGIARNEPSGRPVGGVLTQDFHPGHNGLDFGIPVGTQVKSTMDGNVVYAGWNDQGYGNLVIVEHGDYKTYYAHLSSIPVSVGDSVSAGETIGLSGNTGNSTGPHLHYEIRRNNVPIDPTAATLGA
jgi:murein DD-endopeptidase MepM/ murein hydrolase activator NlpD